MQRMMGRKQRGLVRTLNLRVSHRSRVLTPDLWEKGMKNEWKVRGGVWEGNREGGERGNEGSCREERELERRGGWVKERNREEKMIE